MFTIFIHKMMAFKGLILYHPKHEKVGNVLTLMLLLRIKTMWYKHR